MTLFGDNNLTRIVSITLLNIAMPPFDMEPETITAYVEQLNHIPEKELRMTILQGLTVWYALPSPTEIDALWREMYVPLDPMWLEALTGKEQ